MDVNNASGYYVYLYFEDGNTAHPYYVGKGKGVRAWDRRGRKCPKPNAKNIVILPMNNEQEAFDTECHLVSKWGRRDIDPGGVLYNVSTGGAGAPGVNPSAETRAKLSAAKSGTKHHFFGKKHTKEARQKISEGNSRKTMSAEARAKISAANSGRTFSAEHRAKLSAAAKKRAALKKQQQSQVND